MRKSSESTENYEPRIPPGFLIGMVVPIIAAIPPWTGRYCYINHGGDCIQVDAFELFFWAPFFTSLALLLIGRPLSKRGRNGLLMSTKVSVPLSLIYAVITHFMFLVALGSI